MHLLLQDLPVEASFHVLCHADLLIETGYALHWRLDT